MASLPSPISSARRQLRRSGRRWTAIGMAFCAIAGAGTAGAQGLWEDGAFALYRQAVEAMNKKDYDAADRLVGEAIKLYPNHVLAYYLRGQAALAQSRWDAAATAFGRVTEIYPGSIAGFKSLGVAYEELGKSDDAARAWESALKLAPSDDEMRARLAFLLLRAKREDQGLTLLRELAARDTKNADVWIALARSSYDKGDYPATEKSFVRAVALRDDGPAWYNLGVVRLRMADRAGAIDAFQHAARHAATRDEATKEIERLKAAK
jgi:tetratricopeptide (TPR) repeat protein